MIVAGRLVTPDGIVEGHLRVRGDRIVEVTPARVDVDVLVVPGFVDLHQHGGGGHSVTAGDPEELARAVEFHRGHGTTTLLASLVTGPFDAMRTALTRFAPLVAAGVVAGLHLEGPYLSPAYRGAHPEAHLRHPDPAELAGLLELGGGAVRMVTLAPELPGGLDSIKLLADRGVIPAVGHTAASYDRTRAAVAAGARVATHLFNGEPPVHHRDPGPVPALLGAPGVVCELIADGIHMHPGTLAFAARAAGPDGAALVTDATAAAGMPDGRYRLGQLAITVTDRVARLDSDPPGPLAGSTLTMDAALRTAVAAGVPLVAAVRMAATTPAAVLGLDRELGALRPGLRADLVILDSDLRVVRVMRAGGWLGAPAAEPDGPGPSSGGTGIVKA